MQQLDPGSVDLVFADPPFNIGYKYDVYEDRKDAPSYLSWSKEWISGVHRALKPTGTFWLAIGDDYAAELKILSQQVGFHCRSWVIWYYTFGVNCKYKFSRSHTHIFHFVKDPKTCTFNREAILVPSARQLVYADKRGAKEGRLPDDTWVLRPQDLTEGFQPDDSTWYFPRVAGTFKEREGFHGCQMPEQLLGRIIKVSSNPGELVLDPFSGSSTTVAVAKKLGRQFVAFDISEEYIDRGMKRLGMIEVGDKLDGAEDPKVSAPATGTDRNMTKKSNASKVTDVVSAESTSNSADDLDAGVIEAFRRWLILNWTQRFWRLASGSDSLKLRCFSTNVSSEFERLAN
jgi:DNA modification methylase